MGPEPRLGQGHVESMTRSNWRHYGLERDALTAIDQTLDKAHRLRGGLWEMGKDLVKAAMKR